MNPKLFMHMIFFIAMIWQEFLSAADSFYKQSFTGNRCSWHQSSQQQYFTRGVHNEGALPKQMKLCQLF